MSVMWQHEMDGCFIFILIHPHPYPLVWITEFFPIQGDDEEAKENSSLLSDLLLLVFSLFPWDIMKRIRFIFQLLQVSWCENVSEK